LAAAGPQPLSLRRLRAWAGPGPGGLDLLGAMTYGDVTRAHAAGLACEVPAPLLSGGAGWIDAWSSPGPFVDGANGALRWRHDGSWLFGVLDLPEAPDAGLEAISHSAYRQLFALLRETGFTDIQRLWNYLPRINAEAAGMERYRQFNVGRQRAFIEDGRDVQHSLPAACALGTRDDHLRIRVLAGRRPALPVENPRQVPAFRYPAAYGPKAPSFSRAALVDAGSGQVALLISGTASIVDHASVHLGDVAAQARETLVNLQAVVDAAHARTTARFKLATLDCAVYVRHAADVPAVRAVLVQAIGEDRTAQAVILQADICRSELLVEIEAHAFAAGRLLA
jgi:enamine deaminase RidA (YjgF/YER057c/UK114 family)